MHIVLVYNPIAGRGRAADTAQQFTAALQQANHSVHAIEMQPSRAEQWLDDQAKDADVLVVMGGDGAVRLVSPAASRLGIPIYQVPFGTENLFAREFGMDRQVATLMGALERFEVVRVDVGTANGEQFVLMASIGFDAEVVHDLAVKRSGPITHLSYAGPILRQFRCWHAPTLRISVDGRELELPGVGSVVVANSRQYGMRLDPSPHASMVDGELDVTYFPARSSRDVMYWMAVMRFRRHVHDERVVRASGRHVRIELQPQQRFQLDGDAPVRDVTNGHADVGCVGELDIHVQPAVLPVLTTVR